MQDGIYVKITTEKGEIVGELTYQKTPGTVGNFVALAEGDLENSAKPQGTPYYDGLKFHRVIPDFMIQGGDPAGTGAGRLPTQQGNTAHPRQLRARRRRRERTAPHDRRTLPMSRKE